MPLILTASDKFLLLHAFGTPETRNRVVQLLELAGSGDVAGPVSSIDNAIPRFDGTTGILLQNSPILVGDTGALTAPQISTPSNPASDSNSLYFKSDNNLYKLTSGGTETQIGGGGGSGDVVGPASATDNAISRFDSTTGKLIQNSLVTIDDSGNVQVNQDSGTASSIALNIQQNTAVGGANVLVNNANLSAGSVAFDLQYAGALAVNFGVIRTGGINHGFFDYGNGSSAFTTIQEAGTKNVIIGAGTDTGNARLQINGHLELRTTGNGFKIKGGANAKVGLHTLGGTGTDTISNTSVTANSIIMVTPQVFGGTPVRQPMVNNIVPGVSFDLLYTAADTSTVAYFIIEIV